MNKRLGILWTLSLLITFYLGYSYKSQPLNITSLPKRSILQTNESVLKKPSTSVVASQQKSQAKSDINKVSRVDIIDVLAEMKVRLGTGVDMVGTAKAYHLVNSLSKQELNAALLQLQDTTNHADNFLLLSLLLSKNAEQDPQASMAYIEEHITSRQSKTALSMSIITIWSKKDALSAYDWFKSQDKSKRNSSMTLMPIFTELTKQDFQSAVDKLIELPKNSKGKYSAVRGMSLAFTSSTEFIELMDKTSDLADNRLNDTVIYSWASQNPHEAIEWIDTIVDNKERTRLQARVLPTWIRSEPMEAANWYLGIAEPDEKQSYANKISTHLSRIDPETAFHWLEQQTEIDQDKSTVNILNSSIYSDTDFVINNLHLVNNEKDLLKISSTLARTLERKNPKKATAFVEQSPLKEVLQKQLAKYRTYRENKSKG